MKIKYFGHSCFKITGKTDSSENISIITDPFDPKSTGLTLPMQEAEIVSVSHQHADHNFVEKVKPKDGKLFVADTPGEYEINDLRIYGIKSFHDNVQGKERGSNTIFIYDFQEARVAHLGDIGHSLTSDQIEELENIEILMIPVGGIYTIDPKIAWEIIDELEPLLVIPMHYKTPKHTSQYSEMNSLDAFTSKHGINVSTTDELVIKGKEDLPNTMSVIELTI